MATMKEIQADVEALKQDAVDIRNSGNQILTQATKAAELKSMLAEGWKGKSGTAVATMLDIWSKQEKEIGNNLIAQAKVITNYANSIDTTDKGLAGWFGSLFK